MTLRDSWLPLRGSWPRSGLRERTLPQFEVSDNGKVFSPHRLQAKPPLAEGAKEFYFVVISTTSPIDAARVTLRGAAAVWV